MKLWPVSSVQTSNGPIQDKQVESMTTFGWTIESIQNDFDERARILNECLTGDELSRECKLILELIMLELW